MSSKVNGLGWPQYTSHAACFCEELRECERERVEPECPERLERVLPWVEAGVEEGWGRFVRTAEGWYEL